MRSRCLSHYNYNDNSRAHYNDNSRANDHDFFRCSYDNDSGPDNDYVGHSRAYDNPSSHDYDISHSDSNDYNGAALFGNLFVDLFRRFVCDDG